MATYLISLLAIGWCLSENSYSLFISKLNEIKPGIKLKIDNQKKVNNSNIVTSGNGNKINNLCIRSSGNGGGGGNNANTSKHYQDCKTCEKRCLGECQLLANG